MPYECKTETCQKRFSRIDTLKVHERIHTGEMPFECKTCEKRFNQQINLKIHERIHTEENVNVKDVVKDSSKPLL